MQQEFISMRKLLVFAAIVCAHQLNAQLLLNAQQPQYLPAYNFLSADYEVTNVYYTGLDSTFAQFDGTNSNLGLSKGFVLATGNPFFSGLAGPNGLPDAGIDTSAPGHPILDSILGGDYSHDATVLEFDFIPQVDTISINYVFGSEEYDEYVGSEFNDPVVILLIGPGYDTVNIALLADGQPLAINNVHGSISNTFGNFSPVNESQFVNNPQSQDPTTIQLDGFTTNTRAFADNLSIGQTYRMIIAIGDGGDGIYDSAIFLEACDSCDYALNISETVAESFVKVHPNPATSIAKIDFGGQNGAFEIVDALGKRLIFGEMTPNKTVDIRSLLPGIYFVRTESGSVTSFVKE